MAIAHKILLSIYYMLLKNEPYKELGKDYLNKQGHAKKLKYYQKQLEDLGYDVAISTKELSEAYSKHPLFA